MPTLVIRDLPSAIHGRLRDASKRSRRSMTQEAIMILDAGLRRPVEIPELEPYEGRRRLTARFVSDARREGRA